MRFTFLAFFTVSLLLPVTAAPPAGDVVAAARANLKKPGLPKSSTYSRDLLATGTLSVDDRKALITFMQTDLLAARTARYSKAYAQLMQAREALADGRWADAHSAADEVPSGGTLWEAAGIVRIDALLFAGHLDKATELADELAASPRVNAFSGEIFLRQAELAWLSGDSARNRERAIERLDACLSWIGDTRTKHAPGASPTGDVDIDADAREVLKDFPVGKTLLLPGDTALTIDIFLSPATAPWYLDALGYRARLLDFAISLTDQRERADTALKAVSSGIARARPDLRETFARLKASLDESAFLVPADHWKNARYWKRHLHLASYYTVLGDADRAVALYGLLDTDKQHSPTPDERAIQAIGLASAYRQLNRPLAAQSALAPFAGPLHRHPLASLADYLAQTL